MTPSVPQYISEVTDVWCSNMHREIPFPPNRFLIDGDDVDLKLRDWRGRCFPVNTSENHLKNGTRLRPFGPPLWESKCSED